MALFDFFRPQGGDYQHAAGAVEMEQIAKPFQRLRIAPLNVVEKQE